MPHKDSTTIETGEVSEQPACIDRGIINTVSPAESDGELQAAAEEFYGALSEKQKGVVQAKQQAELVFAAITHADSKSEQVERMDKRVLSGSVFAQAASLAVSAVGYDGEEDEKEEKEKEEEGKAKEEGEDDEEESAKNKRASDNDEQAEEAQGEGEDDIDTSHSADTIVRASDGDEPKKPAAHNTRQGDGEQHKLHIHHSHHPAAQ